jgi:hypothetical protein
MQQSRFQYVKNRLSAAAIKQNCKKNIPRQRFCSGKVVAKHSRNLPLAQGTMPSCVLDL